MAMPNGIHSTRELLDAQVHVWNHIFNFINSMALKCAIQLGLPDIIHGHRKPMTLSDLTTALPITKSKTHCIDRLMRILVHSGFFIKVTIPEEDDEEVDCYWLTPASSLLLRDNPSSIAPFALAMLDPILTNPWHDMGSWFLNDELTPFVTTHGETFWERAGREPRMNHFFNEAMASDAQLVARVLIKNCKHVFEGLESIVDVGGGTGTVARLIGDAFPELNCVVLDLPHVVVGLEGTNKLTFVGGDMFQSIPHGDAILMKWILHDWSDEECVKILKKCKETIPSKGGKLIIIDIVMENKLKEEHKTTETKLFFDMLMMNFVPGRERNEEEWSKLFFAAGFTTYKISHVLGLRSLMEVFP